MAFHNFLSRSDSMSQDSSMDIVIYTSNPNVEFEESTPDNYSPRDGSDSDLMWERSSEIAWPSEQQGFSLQPVIYVERIDANWYELLDRMIEIDVDVINDEEWLKL
jgi:hypothetical protein